MIYGLTMPLARMAKEQGYPEYPLTTPIKVGDKAEDGSQLRPYIVMFGEYIDGMNVAIDIVSMAYTYKYPRPAVTADCIVITKEAEPKVLLIERGDEPFKGCWAFPGGFMNMDETTEQWAIRELEAQWFPLSSFLDKPSGRSSFAGLLPTGRKKAERPELAFDHEEIMKDAINVYGNIMN